MIGDPFAPSCKTLAGKKQILVTALVLFTGTRPTSPGDMIGDPFAPSCKTLAGKKQTLVTALVPSQGLDQLHQVSIGGVHSPHYASVCVVSVGGVHSPHYASVCREKTDNGDSVGSITGTRPASPGERRWCSFTTLCQCLQGKSMRARK